MRSYSDAGIERARVAAAALHDGGARLERRLPSRSVAGSSTAESRGPSSSHRSDSDSGPSAGSGRRSVPTSSRRGAAASVRRGGQEETAEQGGAPPDLVRLARPPDELRATRSVLVSHVAAMKAGETRSRSTSTSHRGIDGGECRRARPSSTRRCTARHQAQAEHGARAGPAAAPRAPSPPGRRANHVVRRTSRAAARRAASPSIARTSRLPAAGAARSTLRPLSIDAGRRGDRPGTPLPDVGAEDRRAGDVQRRARIADGARGFLGDSAVHLDRQVGPTRSRSRRTLSGERSMNGCPPHPGLRSCRARGRSSPPARRRRVRGCRG